MDVIVLYIITQTWNNKDVLQQVNGYCAASPIMEYDSVLKSNELSIQEDKEEP